MTKIRKKGYQGLKDSYIDIIVVFLYKIEEKKL